MNLLLSSCFMPPLTLNKSLTLCSFYDRSSPIYTQSRYLPPSKMLDADVTDSVIGDGCVINVSYLQIACLTCSCILGKAIIFLAVTSECGAPLMFLLFLHNFLRLHLAVRWKSQGLYLCCNNGILKLPGPAESYDIATYIHLHKNAAIFLLLCVPSSIGGVSCIIFFI